MANTTGDSNTFTGASSGAANTTGTSNSFVGIGMSAPQTALDVLGAITLRDGPVVSLTADNQDVTVGNQSYIRLNSDNATAANRTLKLSDGLVRGQLLILQGNSSGNACQLADSIATSNADTAGNRDLGFGAIIMLSWNGTAWFEISYTDS